jgi:small subunit ribosomal protein S6
MSVVKQRTYELIYLLHRDVNEEDGAKLQDCLNGVIAEFNGSVIKEESWGKRKLAYEIKKGVNTYNKALYKYVVFKSEPSVITELERVLRISDHCIRFMNIRLDNFDPASASPMSASAETSTEENA